MKQSILILIFVISNFFGFSQTVEEIKQNPKYLWGIGNGVTMTEANRIALYGIISQISDHVSAETSQFVEEEETDNFKVDTSIKKNLEKYREIVDDKDNVYIKNNEKKEKIKEKTNFSIEELYKLKRGKNTFNSIKVL